MNSSGPSSANGNASSAPKRVLIVSYDFPPDRTSAVYRMTGMASYLPRSGWEPTVLTTLVRNLAHEPKLLEKLPPQVSVVRTKYLRINGWEKSTATIASGVGALRPKAVDARQPLRDRFIRWLGDLVRSTLYFPDEMVGWVPFALREAIRLHREQPFDAVYTTSPPRSALIIGLWLKVFFGVPWVCELMDPWYPPKGRIRRWFDDWLQALLLRNSDRVVVMVRQHATELTRLFGIPAGKMVVVRNGFYEEDFAPSEIQHRLEPGYFHLSHFGTIYPGNDGKFFPALVELVQEYPELKKRLRLNLTGFPHSSVLEYTGHPELKEILQFHGFLEDRAEILQMMRSSDCLLLFWGRPDFSQLAIAGKTYDYLRVGRPIFAVTGEGGIKELVEQGEAGWVVPPDNPKAIKEALKTALSQYPNGSAPSPARPEFVAQFRWDRQAEVLAQTLNEAEGCKQ